MVKIIYDSNNKEESQIIEDYFFYKYYVNSFSSDWKFLSEEYEKSDHFERLEIDKRIIKELNPIQFKRAVKIHKKIYNQNMQRFINENYFISDILFGDIDGAKILKHELIREFKPKINNLNID